MRKKQQEKNVPGEFAARNIKLVIGLGNPGKEYENTYHNVGFLLLEYLTKAVPNSSAGGLPAQAGGSASGGKFPAWPAGRQILNSKLLKSDTYMNASGLYVQKAIKKHGVRPERLLVTHDDSDIALGNFKLSFGRGAAGHKGVESVIAQLGTKNFWRARIGIRQSATDKRGLETRISAENIGVNLRKYRRKSARLKAADFVLKKISSGDKNVLVGVFEKIATRLALQGLLPIDK